MKNLELAKELKLAKMKLKNLPLDCSDAQWERRQKRVDDLTNELNELLMIEGI